MSQAPVLFVLEDEPLLAAFIGALGEAAGFDSRVVLEPGDLLRLVGEHLEAALMLDIVMPNMDGLEVLQKLAAAGFRGPIQVLSGSGTLYLETVGRLAARQGLRLAGVCEKPVTEERLRNILATLMAQVS